MLVALTDLLMNYLPLLVCVCFRMVLAGRKTRTLYTARMGHTEWVTCVAHVPSPGGARVVSGAMDSKLCLWER